MFESISGSVTSVISCCLYCVLQSNSGPGKAVKPGKEGKADEGPWDSSRDLFIDDEAIEGSGARGEVTTDLESSGSGWGPDDEDSGLPSSGAGSLPSPQPPNRLPIGDDDEDHTISARPTPHRVPTTSASSTEAQPDPVTVDDDDIIVIDKEKTFDVDSE